jgi:putative ABC transport system permease protein
MLMKLALRNLLQHRSKSIIVGALMAFGVMLLVVGNSVMDTLSYKIRTSFTEQYSGDLFIYSDPVAKAVAELQPRLARMPEATQKRQLANAQATEDNTDLFDRYGGGISNAMANVEANWQALNQLDYIDTLSPQVNGRANIEDGKGAESFSMFWGIDVEAWQKIGFAQHLEWQQGGFWQAGDKGIAISSDVAKRYAKSLGRDIKVGEEVLLTATSDVGTVIRPVTVSGIFSFKTTSAPQLGFTTLVDLGTGQSLVGLNIDTSESSQLSEAEQTMLKQGSEDDLFGGAGLFSDSADNSVQGNDLEAELMASLSSNKQQKVDNAHLYHYVLVKLKPGIDQAKAQQQLAQWFQQQGLDWTLGDWEKAAGMIASMANNISLVLNGFMVLIAIVAIIIIMNTLVISVTERMVEIGTMRALGGQKSFVRRLILLETLILAIAAGIAGIAAAIVVVGVLALIGIEPTNSFFSLVFGGEALYPSLSFAAMGNALVMMVIAALIASLYPLAIALKVSPVKAMQG